MGTKLLPAGMSAINGALSLITITLIARETDLSTFGQYSAIRVTVDTLCGLVSLGLHSAIIRDFMKSELYDWMPATMVRLATALPMLAIGAWSLPLALVPLFVLAIAVAVFDNSFILDATKGVANELANQLVRTGTVALGSLAILFLVRPVEPELALANLYLGGYLVYGTVVVARTWRTLHFARPNWMAFRGFLKGSLFLIFSFAISIVSSRIDQLMLASLSSDTQMGLYSIGNIVFQVVLVLSSVVMRQIYVKENALGPSGRASRLLRNLAVPALIGPAAVTIMWAIDISPLLLAVNKPSSPELLDIIRLFTVVSAIYLLNTVLATQLVLARRDNVFFAVSFINLALKVSLGLLLIPAIGAEGALFATLAGAAVSLAALGIATYRTFPPPAA